MALGEAGAERTRTVAEVVASLALPSGRLTRVDLERVVAAVAARPALFEDLIVDDTEHRWWMQLLRTARLDLRILSWEREQSSDYHDHGGSSGAFCVTSGAVAETARGADGVTTTTRRFAAGALASFGPDHVHDVTYDLGTPAVSIHAYSPALSNLTYYERTPLGFLATEVRPEEVRGVPHRVVALTVPAGT